MRTHRADYADSSCGLCGRGAGTIPAHRPGLVLVLVEVVFAAVEYFTVIIYINIYLGIIAFSINGTIQQRCGMNSNYDNGWRIIYLFHIRFSFQLFDDYFLSVHDVDTLAALRYLLSLQVIDVFSFLIHHMDKAKVGSFTFRIDS